LKYSILTVSKFFIGHTSRLLDFIKELNEILGQEEKERLLSQLEGLDCFITDLKQLGIYKIVYFIIIIIVITTNQFFLFRYENK